MIASANKQKTRAEVRYMPDPCPICKLSSAKVVTGQDVVICDCDRCGTFSLPPIVSRLLARRNSTELAILSHAVRKMQAQTERPFLTKDVTSRIIEDGHVPSPHEQADNLILWLGNNSPGAGEYIGISPLIHQAVIGSASESGAGYVISHLLNNGLAEGHFRKADQGGLIGGDGRLTFDGWERYEKIKQGRTDSKKAFMAMKFGDDLLDRVFKEVFRPAVSSTGFDLVRLDDRPQAGLIDDRLRVEILTSRFLLADITYGNQGAYWEAGYAEGLGKPVIYTCESRYFRREPPHDDGAGSHFDTNHHLTVIWKDSDLARAAEELKATIRATLPAEAKLED